jgi:uncharacterized membrane protein
MALSMIASPGHAEPSVFVGLGSLTGESGESEARAISADGSKVVGVSSSFSANYEGFWWTSELGMMGPARGGEGRSLTNGASLRSTLTIMAVYRT